MYWCPRWWAHPEAVSRLHAGWQAWDALRASDPTGMSVWWVHHVDPHLDRLAAEYGPLNRCRPDKHVDATTLPVIAAPDDVRAGLPDGTGTRTPPPRRDQHRTAVHKASPPSVAAGTCQSRREAPHLIASRQDARAGRAVAVRPIPDGARRPKDCTVQQ
ncbi:DUF4913 domain-containing protein [Micromonospora inyonensis]|uniref:DUF4913 domain-containing protein n=1 Tax=Micromonospora inyonensis TaxID=47866 RepID=UPI001FE1F0D6